MNEILAQLLELQNHDKEIIDSTRQIEDIPARKAHIEEHVSTARQALDEARRQLQSEQVALDELEVDVGSNKEKIARLQQQEHDVKNNDEYRAIQKELFALRQNIAKAEDRELEIMESMESVKALVAEREEALKEQESHIREDIDELDQFLRELEENVARLKAEREKIAADVDPRWLTRYERVLNHRGGVAIVPIQAGSCSGCNMSLPPQTVQNAKNGIDIAFCDYCGRLLYYSA